jgi:choline dehydrogenase-like flavoprotein
MPTIIQPARAYPVIVVGSGASGGMAAWNLTRQGVDVLLLDAGGKFDRGQYWTHVTAYEDRARRARGERPPVFFLDTKEQPYTTPQDRPFELIRVWGHGGKTNVWGRVSLRYSELDFRAGERDGWDIPWPIHYSDLAPYYDQVDQLIGVCGGDDDSDVLPGSRHHLPPPPMRCAEVTLARAGERIGMPFVRIRRANMTRPVGNFPACHYCGNCGRGCDTASFFCSADHLLPLALQTGRLEIRSHAVVARILVDGEGNASGVQYFDRQSGQEHQVRGKVVVMGASCVDTTRILLNSTSAAHPNGIGNASDVIGRYLCEQVRIHARGFMPSLYGKPTTDDKGIGGAHVYMPRFNHRDPHRRDYLRGFGMQFWHTGCNPDGAGHFAGGVPGFGSSYKAEVRKMYPAWVEMHPFGEVLTYPDNRITVDPARTDRYGVPLVHIDYRIRENEMKMAEHMADAIEELAKASGVELWKYRRADLDRNGSAIHEHGTCRMGDDPKRSALNAFNQMHEVKNVFVVDGSSFTTASEKNPTITILAIAWRATDYLVEQMKRGHV